MVSEEEPIDIVRDFRRIYRRITVDGRASALFGQGAEERAAELLRQVAIKDAGQAGFYFEFPLSGEPYLDLLMQYQVRNLKPPVEFIEGDRFGFASFFDACARDESLKKYICGLSLDINADLPTPSNYLLPCMAEGNAEYVPAMLERLGGGERTDQVMAAFAAAPDKWQAYYAGFMVGRPGAPTRMAFALANPKTGAYAADVAAFARDIEAYYKTPFSAEGRAALLTMVELANAPAIVWELQFDLYPDGTFGDGLAVEIFLEDNDFDARRATGSLEHGELGEIMRFIERVGVADSRWHLMEKACCGQGRILRENGKLRIVGDIISPNVLKLRFKQGSPCLAKGYLYATSKAL